MEFIVTMELKAFPLLCTRSKKAILRVSKKFGHPYEYNPRLILLHRIANKFNITIDEAKELLLKEREFLLRNRKYYSK